MKPSNFTLQRIVFTIALLIHFSLSAYNQTYVGRQLVDSFPRQWGAKTYALTWLPTDYSATSTRYPLIIFMHGAGEAGSTVADLSKLTNTGLPQIIANGWNPEMSYAGQAYKFIVVSPQHSNWSYDYPENQLILNDIIAKYRVDT